MQSQYDDDTLLDPAAMAEEMRQMQAGAYFKEAVGFVGLIFVAALGLWLFEPVLIEFGRSFVQASDRIVLLKFVCPFLLVLLTIWGYWLFGKRPNVDRYEFCVGIILGFSWLLWIHSVQTP